MEEQLVVCSMNVWFEIRLLFYVSINLTVLDVNVFLYIYNANSKTDETCMVCCNTREMPKSFSFPVKPICIL